MSLKTVQVYRPESLIVPGYTLDSPMLHIVIHEGAPYKIISRDGDWVTCQELTVQEASRVRLLTGIAGEDLIPGSACTVLADGKVWRFKRGK